MSTWIIRVRRNSWFFTRDETTAVGIAIALPLPPDFLLWMNSINGLDPVGIKEFVRWSSASMMNSAWSHPHFQSHSLNSILLPIVLVLSTKDTWSKKLARLNSKNKRRLHHPQDQSASPCESIDPGSAPSSSWPIRMEKSISRTDSSILKSLSKPSFGGYWRGRNLLCPPRSGKFFTDLVD